LHSARNAFDPGDHRTWLDYAFETKNPKHNFGWGDILLTVEFKRIKPEMTEPPPKYENKIMESIKPQPLHPTSERHKIAEPISSMYSY
jgi:hypothetical protein